MVFPLSHFIIIIIIIIIIITREGIHLLDLSNQISKVDKIH